MKYKVHIGYLIVLVVLSVFYYLSSKKATYLGWKIEGMLTEVNKQQEEVLEMRRKLEIASYDAINFRKEAREANAQLETLRKDCAKK